MKRYFYPALSHARIRISVLTLSVLMLTMLIQLLPAKSTGKAYDKLRDLPLGKPLELIIPTYDKSNQGVHPDILQLNHSKWKKYPFAMAFTPYPQGNDDFENPCLIISKDGITWKEPKKGLNPLALGFTNFYNNDTDITYNPETKEYYIHYQETCKPDSQNVIRLTSNNLLKWTKTTTLHYKHAEENLFMVSPAVIRKAKGEWYMYYVNIHSKFKRIEYKTSQDGIHWEKYNAKVPVIKNSPAFSPWHTDIFRGKDYYYMLTCGVVENPNLYLARSSDLVNWQYLPEPIISADKSLFNSNYIYRSTGLQDGNNLYVWFSYRAEGKKWGMAVQRFDLSKFVW